MITDKAVYDRARHSAISYWMNNARSEDFGGFFKYLKVWDALTEKEARTWIDEARDEIVSQEESDGGYSVSSREDIPTLDSTKLVKTIQDLALMVGMKFVVDEKKAQTFLVPRPPFPVPDDLMPEVVKKEYKC